jgi:hypothetical protein
VACTNWDASFTSSVAHTAASQHLQHIHAKLKKPPPTGEICWGDVAGTHRQLPSCCGGNRALRSSTRPQHTPHTLTPPKETTQQIVQCCLSPTQDKHCRVSPTLQTQTQTACCWGIHPTDSLLTRNPRCVLPRSHERALEPYPMPCKLHKHGLRHNSTQAAHVFTPSTRYDVIHPTPLNHLQVPGRWLNILYDR